MKVKILVKISLLTWSPCHSIRFKCVNSTSRSQSSSYIHVKVTMLCLSGAEYHHHLVRQANRAEHKSAVAVTLQRLHLSRRFHIRGSSSTMTSPIRLSSTCSYLSALNSISSA